MHTFEVIYTVPGNDSPAKLRKHFDHTRENVTALVREALSMAGHLAWRGKSFEIYINGEPVLKFDATQS